MLVFLHVDYTIVFMSIVVTSEVSVDIATEGTPLAPGNSHDARPGAETKQGGGVSCLSSTTWGAWSPGVVLLRGQMPRATSNGGTVPRGGANKSLTTDTPVGITILTTDESGRSSPATTTRNMY